MFTTCLNETISADGRPLVGISPHLVDDDNRIEKAQNRNFLLAEGFRRATQNSPSWNLFLRYQAQSERLYRRAIEEFNRLKALRHELPNEPMVEVQPEATETTCTPDQTNPIPPAKPAAPPHPPEHYGPDGELRFPYDRPDYQPAPAPPDPAPNHPLGPPDPGE